VATIMAGRFINVERIDRTPMPPDEEERSFEVK
jgi:hypothetical protein